MYANLVRETTTTTGTGDVTLAGAVTGFRSFNTAFGVNPRFYYEIRSATVTDWEIGVGYLSGSTTLVRETVIDSSNAGALVSFAAGAKDVYNTLPAEPLANLDVEYLVNGTTFIS